MKISIQNYLTVVVALVLVTVEAAPAAELSDKYPSFSLSEVLDKKGLYFTKQPLQIPRIFLNTVGIWLPAIQLPETSS